MSVGGRYSDAIVHRGPEAIDFVADYFAGRSVLMIAGAGFDPRASIAVRALAGAGAALDLHLVREHRPSPLDDLTEAADQNERDMAALAWTSKTHDVDILDLDGAIIGGRRLTGLLHEVLEGSSHDDVVIDMSALSVGTSFPTIKLAIQHLMETDPRRNLHVFVAHAPFTDYTIKRVSTDRATWVHGFQRQPRRDERRPAVLWMPQMSKGAQSELTRIYNLVTPDDTCPILPFPSAEPLLGDQLALEYAEELLNVWNVDMGDVVYAAEDDPLDVYRTICGIDRIRQNVFAATGGSEIVLSPTGSKLTALGTLMACVELDLPVAHLEAESYHSLVGDLMQSSQVPELVHLWLHGVPFLVDDVSEETSDDQ